MTLLDVAGLTVDFGTGEAAVRGVSFHLDPGECLAIVGESGSGKSVTARALLGLSGGEVAADRLHLDGRDLRTLNERAWRDVRGRRIGFVLQDALQALDPLRRIGREVAEPLLVHRTVPRGEVAGRVRRLLADVGIPDPERRAREHPHQLSGGLRQRALIASALACGPELIIADEPTTALDVTVQAQVLDLLAGLRAAGTAVVLISHDLAVVARLADRIAVMRDGTIVEQGPAERILTDPGDPYTKALLAAVPEGTAPPATPGPPVLQARSITKRFGDRTALGDVSFDLHAGETLGLVGESGSGKTTLARIALGLLPADSGEVTLTGEPWSALPERLRRPHRHRIQPVPQDPAGAFDPRHTVARILTEALAVAGTPRADRRDRAADLLRQVGLGPEHLGRRPRQLSGGQRQRVAIARALASDPAVLVCDEPTSALDVSVQAEILALLGRLQAEHGLAMLFITHDLAVVRQVAHRVMVLKDGDVVESGPAAEVLASPEHPYTRTLLAAAPRLPVR
ncbi:dipeptide ABC transporter ATP-binding protein [Actinomadura hibisca]|uniref:dipeptide ABC transporter ATP-binding protein n=1 Tax=Actinomadura hibisca TaxID=68565 RepID=UPI00082A718C|nr:ABC transporter ATP-binding protein [Actinomadura hibisca]